MSGFEERSVFVTFPKLTWKRELAQAKHATVSRVILRHLLETLRRSASIPLNPISLLDATMSREGSKRGTNATWRKQVFDVCWTIHVEHTFLGVLRRYTVSHFCRVPARLLHALGTTPCDGLTSYGRPLKTIDPGEPNWSHKIRTK